MAAEIMKDFNVTQEDAEILARARMIRDEAKKYADFMDRKWFEAWFGFLPFFNLGDILPAVASSAYLMYLGKKMGFKLEDYWTIAGTQVIDVWIWLLPIVWNIIWDFLWKSNKQSVTLFDRCIRNMEKEMIKRWNTEKEIKIVEAERWKISDAIQSYIESKSSEADKEELNKANGTLAEILLFIVDIRKRWITKEEIDALEERVNNTLKDIEWIINDMESKKSSSDEIKTVEEIKTMLEKIMWIIAKIKKWRIEEEDEKTLLETVEWVIGNFFKKWRKKITTEKTDEEKKQKEEERENKKKERENKKKERRQKKAQRKQRKEVEQQESKIKKLIKGKSIEPNESNYENYTITKDNLDRVCKLLFDGTSERYKGIDDWFKDELLAKYDYETTELTDNVIQDIFKYCRGFKSANQAARDILLLATKKESAEPKVEESEENLKQQVVDTEKEIEDFIKDKGIRIKSSNYQDFTISDDDCIHILNCIFSLLELEPKDYWERYRNIDKNFINELLRIANQDRDYWQPYIIQQMFDFLFKNKDEANKKLVNDILVLAHQKDTEETESQESEEEKKLKAQAKAYEDIIKDARKGTIKVDDENSKENCYLDLEKFKAVYYLLFWDEKDYSDLYKDVDINFKNELNWICNPWENPFSSSVWIFKENNWTKKPIMDIFDLCLRYKNKTAAAKDILYLADDKVRREAQSYEKQIIEHINKKTKDDIMVTWENYTNFTIKADIFEPIFSLLYWTHADYSKRYDGTDSELKEKLKNHIKDIYENKNANIDDDIRQIFEICLDYPNDPLAIDILLLAIRKELWDPSDGDSLIVEQWKIKLSELHEKFEDIARFVVEKQSAISNAINFNFWLDFSTWELVMQQLKDTGIVWSDWEVLVDEVNLDKILEKLKQNDEWVDEELDKESGRDKLFDEAALIVVQTQQGSSSILQRKLKIWYVRVGRILDQLEAVGIVGPFNGSHARDVKVKDEAELENILEDLHKIDKMKQKNKWWNVVEPSMTWIDWDNEEEIPLYHSEWKKYDANPELQFGREEAKEIRYYEKRSGEEIWEKSKQGLENTIKYLNGEISCIDYIKFFWVSENTLKTSKKSTIKAVAEDIANCHKPFLIEIQQEEERVQWTTDSKIPDQSDGSSEQSGDRFMPEVWDESSDNLFTITYNAKSMESRIGNKVDGIGDDNIKIKNEEDCWNYWIDWRIIQIINELLYNNRNTRYKDINDAEKEEIWGAIYKLSYGFRHLWITTTEKHAENLFKICLKYKGRRVAKDILLLAPKGIITKDNNYYNYDFEYSDLSDFFQNIQKQYNNIKDPKYTANDKNMLKQYEMYLEYMYYMDPENISSESIRRENSLKLMKLVCERSFDHSYWYEFFQKAKRLNDSEVSRLSNLVPPDSIEPDDVSKLSLEEQIKFTDDFFERKEKLKKNGKDLTINNDSYVFDCEDYLNDLKEFEFMRTASEYQYSDRERYRREVTNKAESLAESIKQQENEIKGYTQDYISGKLKAEDYIKKMKYNTHWLDKLTPDETKKVADKLCEKYKFLLKSD